MAQNIIPLREEQTTDVEELVFQPQIEEFVVSSINRRLFPVNTPLPGRSVKMKDVFIFSGATSVSGTVTTVSNTATETNLATFTFLPDEFHVGMTIRIYASGVYSTTAGANRTVTIRVGSGNAPTTEWNSMASTAADVTNVSWHLWWTGIVTAIGTSGTIEAQMQGKINNVNKDDPNTGTVSIDTTGSRIFALTAQWSGAATGDTISIRQFLVEILN